MVGQQGNKFLPFGQTGILTSRQRSGGFDGTGLGLPGLFILFHGRFLSALAPELCTLRTAII